MSGAQKKPSHHISPKMRWAMVEAIRERYPGLSTGEALKCAWAEVIEVEGVARAFELLRHFVPKEVELQGEGQTVFVIGAPPEDPDAWARDHGVADPMVIDGDVEPPRLS